MNLTFAAPANSLTCNHRRRMHHIGPDHLSLETIDFILREHLPLALSDEAKRRIQHCRAYLEHQLNNTADLFYGINTGFGSLCNIRISAEDI